MKILLTNHAMCEPGGTERWTQTMAKTLVALNHQVHLWTPEPGAESTILEDIVAIHKRPPTTELFDLCLVNHNKCLQGINANTSPKIFTAHGPHNPLELPIEGAGAYVAISEEVQLANRSYGFQSTVIRNPISTSEFKPYTVPATTLSNILYLTKGQYPTFGDMLANVCTERDINLDMIHATRYPSCAVALRMQQVDLVVTIGRGVLEAMACGRNVLVCDERTPNGPLGDGMLHPTNIELWRKRNFAGRTGNYLVDEPLLHQWLDTYDPTHIDAFEAYVDRNHNATRIVNKYIFLAERTFYNG